MPRDFDAAPAAATPVVQLQSVFDASLYRASQQLIDLQQVSDVRVLQNGRVVTGIAGGARVYIQYHHTGALNIEGECSCGDISPCVHVAAVAITAARNSAATSGTLRSPRDPSQGHISQRPPQSAAPRSAELRQAIRYLIEADGVRGFRLSAWIAQSLDSGPIPPAFCPFAPRMTESKDYPRYVDEQDREILDALTAWQVGPWDLTGAAGFEVLQRVIVTGRAFWHSLESRALHAAGARAVRFAWQALPNGDQQLRGETAEALDFLLGVVPAVYIDTESGACGPIELAYPGDLLRHYWGRPIDPAQASALNSTLAREPQAEAFPRLRSMTFQVLAPAVPRPRLILSAAPAANLHFIYHGMAFDGDSLPMDGAAVRRREGDVVHQITRDCAVERQLRAQLDQCLGGSPRSAETWLAFMMKGVPALRALGWEIEVEAEFPYRIAFSDDWYADLQTSQPMRANRPSGAKQSREWFDLKLGVMLEGHAVNLLPALVMYLQGADQGSARQDDAMNLLTGQHLLIRLEDGRYLPVPLTRIQRIADALVELYDHGLNERDALRLPATQAGRMAQLALEPDAPALQSDDATLLERIEAMKRFARIEPLAAPAHFQATLRPYQEEGVGWLQFLRRHGLGGILADDMGLGKTVQTLAHLAIEKHEHRLQKPSLIVAPVSVLGNWRQEINRFAPELRLLVLHGARRKESYAAMDSADLILVGYPSLLLDSEILLQREFCFLILDEAQTIKNPHSGVSQVARALRAQHRLCLTGTPMENHLGELWSLFDFVQPGLLGEPQQFQRHYRHPIESGGDSRRAAALSRRIQPFLLRRTKDAVARDLPAKIHIVEAIDFDERQRDFYDGIRLGQHRRVREAIEQRGLARSRLTVLDALLKLRQACCDPRLIDAAAHTKGIPSAKLDWLSTTLPELIAEGRRILLFSQFTAMLRLIEAVVKDLPIPYFLLTGETRQRSELVDGFQAGGAPLFLISLKAGGTGLNLTAADTIIHYDPWWNPAVEAQAADRAHRIGQDKPVFVYKLIARGTVEEKITQLQADKLALVNRLYAEESMAPPVNPLHAEESVAASLAGSVGLDALFAP